MNGGELLQGVDFVSRERNISQGSDLLQHREGGAPRHPEVLRRRGRHRRHHRPRSPARCTAMKGEKVLAPEELGRIAAQAAKQVIIQSFREEESNAVFNEYDAKKGDLVHGTVSRFEGGAATVTPRQDRGAAAARRADSRRNAPRRRARQGGHPRRASSVGHRVKIILSRTHPDFVRRLFENEIPEIERPHHRDQGRGPRGRLSHQDGRLQHRHEGRLRRRLRRRPRQPHQEHRRRAGRRTHRHRALERLAAGADPQRPAAGPDRGGVSLSAAGAGHRAGEGGSAVAGHRPARPERPAGVASWSAGTSRS